ncbi:3-keto-disaccharide hydrolase [Parapedobacter lycopersici]|uniref:3-keto-disaccharide hydrolase n=1 Tax=Parapedobacter lycopersici TaxID=1864939 RepID=UPI00214D81FF|nr:DUF1080 domain-containing protein [Parapedobacter lycopersici]
MKTFARITKRMALPVLATGSLLWITCSGTAERPNTLTPQEAEEGWTLLFDGHSTAGWHIFNQGAVPSAWRAVNGELWCDPQVTDAIHGDLVTDSIYTDFELVFDWKIAKGGNSGVFINVQEGPAYGTAYATGPEMQLLDNEYAEERHRSNPSHLAGSVYDVVGDAEQSKPVPFGQWNHSRVRQEEGKVTFWLNGQVTAEVQLGSETWTGLVATGNLGNFPEFGKAKQGRIALQDHTDEVFFRNMKIKRL